MKKVVLELTDKYSINNFLERIEEIGEDLEVHICLVRVPGEGRGDAILGIAEELGEYLVKSNSHCKVGGYYNFDDTEGFWVQGMKNGKEKMEKYGFHAPMVINMALKHIISSFLAKKIGADEVITGDFPDKYDLLYPGQTRVINTNIITKYDTPIIMTTQAATLKADLFAEQMNIKEMFDELRVDELGNGGWTYDDIGNDKTTAYITEVVEPFVAGVWEGMNCMGFEYE